MSAHLEFLPVAARGPRPDLALPAHRQAGYQEFRQGDTQGRRRRVQSLDEVRRRIAHEGKAHRRSAQASRESEDEDAKQAATADQAVPETILGPITYPKDLTPTDDNLKALDQIYRQMREWRTILPARRGLSLRARNLGQEETGGQVLGVGTGLRHAPACPRQDARGPRTEIKGSSHDDDVEAMARFALGEPELEGTALPDGKAILTLSPVDDASSIPGKLFLDVSSFRFLQMVGKKPKGTVSADEWEKVCSILEQAQQEERVRPAAAGGRGLGQPVRGRGRHLGAVASGPDGEGATPRWRGLGDAPGPSPGSKSASPSSRPARPGRQLAPPGPLGRDADHHPGDPLAPGACCPRSRS